MELSPRKTRGLGLFAVERDAREALRRPAGVAVDGPMRWITWPCAPAIPVLPSPCMVRRSAFASRSTPGTHVFTVRDGTCGVPALFLRDPARDK